MHRVSVFYRLVSGAVSTLLLLVFWCSPKWMSRKKSRLTRTTTIDVYRSSGPRWSVSEHTQLSGAYPPPDRYCGGDAESVSLQNRESCDASACRACWRSPTGTGDAENAALPCFAGAYHGPFGAYPYVQLPEPLRMARTGYKAAYRLDAVLNGRPGACGSVRYWEWTRRTAASLRWARNEVVSV